MLTFKTYLERVTGYAGGYAPSAQIRQNIPASPALLAPPNYQAMPLKDQEAARHRWLVDTYSYIQRLEKSNTLMQQGSNSYFQPENFAEFHPEAQKLWVDAGIVAGNISNVERGQGYRYDTNKSLRANNNEANNQIIQYLYQNRLWTTGKNTYVPAETMLRINNESKEAVDELINQGIIQQRPEKVVSQGYLVNFNKANSVVNSTMNKYNLKHWLIGNVATAADSAVTGSLRADVGVQQNMIR